MDKKGLFWFCLISLLVIIVLIFLNNNYVGIFVKFDPVYTDYESIRDIINSQNKTLTNVYYINLKKSIDRKKKFLSRLDETINPIRIEALSPDTMPKMKKNIRSFPVLDTEFACLSSHLKAIHTAFHNNEDWAIIVEDDVIIKNNIDWQKLIESAPSNWEVLQMHTCCIPKIFNQDSLKYFEDDSTLWVYSNDIVPSAAFYIINRQGMIKLLSRHVIGYKSRHWTNIDMLDLTTSKVNAQADLLLFNNINRYICTFSLIDMEKGKSTIHWAHDKYNDIFHNRNFAKKK